jgi:hypothetical protein
VPSFLVMSQCQSKNVIQIPPSALWRQSLSRERATFLAGSTFRRCNSPRGANHGTNVAHRMPTGSSFGRIGDGIRNGDQP